MSSYRNDIPGLLLIARYFSFKQKVFYTREASDFSKNEAVLYLTFNISNDSRDFERVSLWLTCTKLT